MDPRAKNKMKHTTHSDSPNSPSAGVLLLVSEQKRGLGEFQHRTGNCRKGKKLTFNIRSAAGAPDIICRPDGCTRTSSTNLVSLIVPCGGMEFKHRVT